mgnify:FL=1
MQKVRILKVRGVVLSTKENGIKEEDVSMHHKLWSFHSHILPQYKVKVLCLQTTLKDHSYSAHIPLISVLC